MSKKDIINKLEKLTKHKHIEITSRGNTAIKAALAIVAKDKKIIIPEEGGWLTYETLPAKLGLDLVKVKCDNARINLPDLKEKLKAGLCGAFLYQNPGGYFAQQPAKEIYQLCKKYDCLVILDVSGAMGTKLGKGTHADILVGSFGKWKLVEAGKGGFISSKRASVRDQLAAHYRAFNNTKVLSKIAKKLKELPERVAKLKLIKEAICSDLRNFKVVHPEDIGFVVVVKYKDEREKEKIVAYCKKEELEWTECPRYIRINQEAISIEVKRL